MEVLIVLAIAGLILVIVFIAVPTLQRGLRDQRRRSDAALLLAAVNECMSVRNNHHESCNEPDEIPLDVSEFSIYTGVHYGATPATPPVAIPPTANEPNWLFNTTCNAEGSMSIPSSTHANQVSVSFWLESPGANYPPPYHIYNGLKGRCIST